MAENLDLETKRTGGRVVDCSGLENLAGKTPETAETTLFRPSLPAQEAPFADCSASRDGTQTGTRAYAPKLVWDDATDSWKGDSLYFISDGGADAIKIGRGSALKRLASLQVGNCRPLALLAEIPNAGWQEAFWHCAWGSFTIRGEWFAESPELRSAIDAIREVRDWTDHVPVLIARPDGREIDIGEWQEHMLDAFDAYSDYALDLTPSLSMRRAAELAIFDGDFDGRCIVTQFMDALGAKETA